MSGASPDANKKNKMNKSFETVLQILKTAEGEGKWFNVPQSEFKVYVAVVIITPEIATKLLEMNTKNRPKSKAYVNRYAKIMKQLKWMFNAQAIIFNAEGVVADGQHRLSACIEAGTPFSTMVCLNLPADVANTIDNGRKRNLAQLLAMGNTPNGSAVAAVVNAYVSLTAGKQILVCNSESGCKNTTSTHGGKEHYELVEIYNDNSDEFDLYGRRANELGTAVKKYPISGSVAAAYWMYLVKDKGYDEAFVEKFFRMLYSYETAENHNVNLLRVKFMDMRAGLARDKQDYMATAAYRRNVLAFVWNYYATDHKPVKYLSYTASKGEIEFLSAAQADAVK